MSRAAGEDQHLQNPALASVPMAHVCAYGHPDLLVCGLQFESYGIAVRLVAVELGLEALPSFEAVGP